MKGARIGLFLFFLCMMGFLLFMYMNAYLENKKIKENSIRLESVLIESNGYYTKVYEDTDDYGTSATVLN